jgi:hypothetical protein
MKADDVSAVASGQVIAHGISTKNSKEMAAFGVVLAEASPEAFIDSYRTLAVFDQTPGFVATGRFGAEPSLKDLDQLKIDDKDLYALAKARPRSADIKLSGPEIARMQAIAAAGGRLTPQVKARLADEYKKILLERVKSYLARGAQAMGAYADKDDPVNAHEAFMSLVRAQSEGGAQCEHLYSHLEKYPEGKTADTESFVYWATQKFGDLKPVINLVHVLIHRDGNRIYIASKQIYSSHYTEAALTVAELIPFADNEQQTRTIIAYTLRLQVDMLGGSFGFMKKRMAQPRLVSTLKQSLGGLRTNMEVLSRVASQANP